MLGSWKERGLEATSQISQEVYKVAKKILRGAIESQHWVKKVEGSRGQSDEGTLENEGRTSREQIQRKIVGVKDEINSFGLSWIWSKPLFYSYFQFIYLFLLSFMPC